MTDDEILVKAALLVVLTGKASQLFVQRKLELAYRPASDAIRRLEAANIISKADEWGKRKVLVSPDVFGEDRLVQAIRNLSDALQEGPSSFEEDDSRAWDEENSA